MEKKLFFLVLTSSLILDVSGQMCGGIAGLGCPEGYICHYDWRGPDATGTCGIGIDDDGGRPRPEKGGRVGSVLRERINRIHASGSFEEWQVKTDNIFYKQKMDIRSWLKCTITNC